MKKHKPHGFNEPDMSAPTILKAGPIKTAYATSAGLPVISPPGSFATNQLATKKPPRHQAKSPRHQP